jgi:hypothetical protein
MTAEKTHTQEKKDFFNGGWPARIPFTLAVKRK